MADNEVVPARKPWVSVVSGILATGNFLTAAAGCIALFGTINAIGEGGEQWGVIGYVLVAAVCMVVLILLLLPGSILLLKLAKGGLNRGYRKFLIVTLSVGVATNVAALAFPLLCMAIRGK